MVLSAEKHKASAIGSPMYGLLSKGARDGINSVRQMRQSAQGSNSAVSIVVTNGRSWGDTP